MEQRAKRKDKTDPVTATEAKKPNGGADDCLATDQSVLDVDLMSQVLRRENLQRAWEQVRANNQLACGRKEEETTEQPRHGNYEPKHDSKHHLLIFTDRLRITSNAIGGVV